MTPKSGRSIMMKRMPAMFLAACALAAMAGQARAEARATLPLPEMVVSKTAAPPAIDGRMAPGEWDRAPACTAWVHAFEGSLGLVQSTAWITYDDKYIYVCIKNNRGPKGALLARRARKSDDAAIVFDPSNEIWLTPPVTPAATYQTLFNPYPAVFDAKMIPSVGYTAMSWQGRWKIASSETPDDWIVEARAEIKAFGFDAIKDGSTWGGLFCADLGDGYGFRAWAPGGAFADIPRHGRLHFKDSSPVFQFLTCESVFTGKPALDMAVTGPAKGASDVTVSVRFGPGVAAAPGDLVLEKPLAVADGKRTTFTLSADLAPLKLPLQKVEVEKVQKEVPGGFCEVAARTADGAVLYHQVFPFAIHGWVRTPPSQIKKTPYETPFGLSAFYAPLSKKLIVKADRLYMERRDDVAGGTARLKDARGRVAAERKLAPFYFDYSEFPMDLAGVGVPVETEADWAASKGVEVEAKKIAAENKRNEEANRKIAEQNQELAAEGKPALPLLPIREPKPAAAAAAKVPAEYDLEVILTDAAGKEIAATTAKVKLLGYQFEWLPNTVGVSDKVIPPWTPVRFSNGQVAMWNKTYRLSGLGLAEKIANGGAPQLSSMKMIAIVNGKEVEVKAEGPAVKRETEAGLDLTGRAEFEGLTLSVATRVEFDGFVMNTMELKGAKGARLDRLSLVVTMPKDEAPCFVTTSGGWSAYHGWTPERWDSRETALGSMIGNFVPYVLFTDSDRGFCWFADTDKGWLLDPAAATLQMARQGDQVVFRANFVTRPGTVEQPTTIRYGWTVTPQKPQPKGWRNWTVGRAPNAMGAGVFWCDADWAVLWPYYSSPFPWDYEKSRMLLAGGDGSSGVVNCVGNIAHSIGRYMDAKGRWFNEVAADWGAVPGDLSNGNVCRTAEGSNAFQLWHWDQWIKKSGLSGLYFDETYLGEEWNYLVGNAYRTPDERVQPGYSYLGLRDLFKRLRYVFEANGKRPPNLWLHTTSGQPVYAWMPDVSMEGENVEPAGGDNDYIEALPASRLRSIGMGRNLGSAPFIMCQTGRHYNPAFSNPLIEQFVGWVLLHDALPEQIEFWNGLTGELQMWHDDIRFLPYWKTGQGVASRTPDVLASAHARPGHAVLWIMNVAKANQRAAVALDLKALGLDAARPLRVFDAETGEQHKLAGNVLSVDVPKRMWRCVRLVQDDLLTGGTTFVARFDKDAVADAALGCPLPNVATEAKIPQATAEGKAGKGFALEAAVSYNARHNIPAGQGTIALDLKCDAAMSGTVLAVAPVTLRLDRGKLVIQQEKEKPAEAALQLPADAAWRRFVITWKDLDLKVACDGQEVLAVKLASPLGAKMCRGLQIRDNRSRANNNPPFTLGPIRGAVIDNLLISGEITDRVPR
jgi:hypothetical protein